MNIFILSSHGSGVDVLDVVAQTVPVAGVIGLNERPASDSISGYVYLEPHCRTRGVPFYSVESYGLTRAEDRAQLLELDIDVLLVINWQRLIPEWLIRHCRCCAIGAHGSAYGITGGRGRSPQNWALMMGKTSFHISIFRIDAGIDSGAVIDTREFPLTEWDDIGTSYYKTFWLVAQMAAENIRNGRIKTGAFTEQKESASYLPKRMPEDGEIDWSRSARHIYDFVRALSRPYPGAFSRLGGHLAKIWRVRPFEVPVLGAFVPGTIIKKMHGGEWLVQAGDMPVLVDEFEYDGPPVSTGNAFEACNFMEQMCRIIDRHEQTYPDFPVAKDLRRFAGLNQEMQ